MSLLVASTSSLCGLRAAYLSARLRCKSNGRLRLHKLFDEGTRPSCQDDVLRQLRCLLLVALERCVELECFQVYPVLESLVARVLRVPRLHIRVVATGSKQRRGCATRHDLERLHRLLSAVDDTHVLSDFEVWTAQSRSLAAFLKLVRQHQTEPSALQNTLCVKPYERTMSLLSCVENSVLAGAKHSLGQHQQCLEMQQTSQERLMKQQAQSLHFLALRDCAHYQWQAEVHMVDLPEQEEFLLDVSHDLSMCKSLRVLCEPGFSSEHWHRRDKSFRALLSTPVSHFLGCTSESICLRLVQVCARALLPRIKQTPMPVTCFSFSKFQLDGWFIWYAAPLGDVLRHALSELPREPSEPDWCRIETALRSVSLDQRSYSESNDVALVLLVTAIDVARHHLRFRAETHHVVGHCHGCLLRDSLRPDSMWTLLTDHICGRVQLQRKLLRDLRPPFFVCNNATQSQLDWIEHVFPGETKLFESTPIHRIGHVKPALLSVLRARKYDVCANAVRQYGTRRYGTLRVVQCRSDADIERFSSRAPLLCAVTASGTEYSAVGLVRWHMRHLCELVAAWMNTPTSCLYQCGVDVVCTLFEWLLPLNFGRVLEVARLSLLSRDATLNIHSLNAAHQEIVENCQLCEMFRVQLTNTLERISH
ncbi:MAG: hypothetical protein MHM6MM_003883 [Cercozoa sp. M6MM]